MTAKTTTTDSDFGSSWNSNSNPQIVPRIKSSKRTSRSSFQSVTSSASHSQLTNTQIKEFHDRIKNEHKVLEGKEVIHCYYLEKYFPRACQQLERSDDGTYFVRRAEEEERTSDIKYFLVFVCHKEIVQVPICCDNDHRIFWFLSGYGHGCEVQRFYAGIDLMIKHKRENIFHELQYPFKICLYKPINPDKEIFEPLPDKVRAIGGPSTILHELASQGSSNYFNELIRISKEDGHALQKACEFIVSKIDAKNERGQTPLIVAIQSKQYEFAELLLANKANINMTDSHGCSPLQHLCQQAKPQVLKIFIDRGADPHYFNRRETTDGKRQSYLSAFHYLAMAKGASRRNIKQCAMYLLECKCPLMPLTKEGISPFDIAQMYGNNAYECVLKFCEKQEFNNLLPIEVSSRKSAKRFLRDLACPHPIGKIRLMFKQYDNRDCLGNNGLFLLYRIKQKQNQPNDELGLCVYYNKRIFIYPITQKYGSTITDPKDSSRKIVYNYCLTTGTLKDNHSQMILFRCCEELIFNYSKYQGILPTLLKDFVQKPQDGPLTIDAATKLIIENRRTSIDESEESDLDDEPTTNDFDVTSIGSFDASKISSLRRLDENDRRLIWQAEVCLNHEISFPIIIKDYLPRTDIETFKQYRFNEFSTSSRQKREFSYEFSSRTRLEYKHESSLLRNELKDYPLIVHTFICNHQLEKGLRIFMEYLPLADLNTHLTGLEKTRDSLINAFHWIYQIAQVMAYLSSKKIVHRDLATRNILLNTEQHIKLSDFGLSRREGRTLEENDCTISLRWCPPECFDRNQTVSSSADVWSFGVLVWEIFSFGSIPYDKVGISTADSQQLIDGLKKYLIIKNRHLPKPKFSSESMYALMKHCWNRNIDQRPRFADIINDFNGKNMRKDRMVFTPEEMKAWEKANNKYISIRSSKTLTDGYAELGADETVKL